MVRKTTSAVEWPIWTNHALIRPCSYVETMALNVTKILSNVFMLTHCRWNSQNSFETRSSTSDATSAKHRASVQDGAFSSVQNCQRKQTSRSKQASWGAEPALQVGCCVSKTAPLAFLNVWCVSITWLTTSFSHIIINFFCNHTLHNAQTLQPKVL